MGSNIPMNSWGLWSWPLASQPHTHRDGEIVLHVLPYDLAPYAFDVPAPLPQLGLIQIPPDSIQDTDIQNLMNRRAMKTTLQRMTGKGSRSISGQQCEGTSSPHMPSTNSTVLSSPHPKKKESDSFDFKEEGTQPGQCHTENLDLKPHRSNFKLTCLHCTRLLIHSSLPFHLTLCLVK